MFSKSGVSEGGAASEFDVPGLGKRFFSPCTIKSWLRLYRKHGFEELSHRKRSDAGKQRSIPEPIKGLLRDAKIASPHRPIAAIYRDCLRERSRWSGSGSS
ncbi:MAG: helix-turn-helix domain-containing protein [Clostridia bacterium]|nr:helix-turn-helix domain-containing protein [Clostridia bacterium]